MTRRTIRKIHRQIRKQDRHGSRSNKRSRLPESTPSRPAPEPGALPVFTRRDIVSKLIPLTIPSAKDAQKFAERTIDNVFSAVRHVLSEADLVIADFGEIRASRGAKASDILIHLTPHEKLKHAVEARVNALL
jgi:hypothetical protein